MLSLSTDFDFFMLYSFSKCKIIESVNHIILILFFNLDKREIKLYFFSKRSYGK